MKKSLVISFVAIGLFLLIAVSGAFAAELPELEVLQQENNARLAWTAPLFRENESDLLDSEIKSYSVAYGLTSVQGPAQVFDVGKVNTYLIENLSPGEYQFAVLAVDNSGTQSKWIESDLFTITEASRPNPPGDFSVIVGGYLTINVYLNN